jgi:hypothetical protein
VGVLTVLLLGGVLTGVGEPRPSSQRGPVAAGLPTDPAGPADTPADQPSRRTADPAADPADPGAAVPALSGHRVAAFSTGSRAPLDLADVAGSPALAADEAVLATLAAQGTVLQGLALEVRDVVLVSHVGDAASVRVTTVSSAHRVVRTADDSVVRDVPESAPRTVELALRHVDSGWRVEAVVG